MRERERAKSSFIVTLIHNYAARACGANCHPQPIESERNRTAFQRAPNVNRISIARTLSMMMKQYILTYALSGDSTVSLLSFDMSRKK